MSHTLQLVLAECSEWIIKFLPTIFSALSSFLIAFFIGVYDRKVLWKLISGPVVCGLFTLVISGSLEHLGLADSAIPLVGGVIGFIGVDKLREVIEGRVHKQWGGDNNENQR